MGHTFREMFPQQAAKQDAYIARKLAIQEEILQIDIGEFKVGDLPALVRIMNAGNRDAREEDFERIEERARDIKKRIEEKKQRSRFR